jgi:hypothetical protein
LDDPFCDDPFYLKDYGRVYQLRETKNFTFPDLILLDHFYKELIKRDTYIETQKPAKDDPKLKYFNEECLGLISDLLRRPGWMK